MARDGEKTLDKAFRLLDAVGAGDGGIGAAEAAKTLGLTPPTAFRLLKFLHARGLVAKDGPRYRLGPAAIRLGVRAAEQNPLRRVARPWLVELAAATRETVHLGELRGNEVVYVDKIEGQRPLRIRSLVGGRCPLHCSGIGKALWAFLPNDQRETLLKAVKLTRHTEHTLTTAAAMRRELARIARQGYAVDRVEHEPGVYCLGAPVLDASGHAVAAVSIAGAESYLRPQTAALAKRLVACAKAIGKAWSSAGAMDFA